MSDGRRAETGGSALPQTSLQTLRRHAERFRWAIEACERSLLPVTFERFPRGSCGDANLLLGNYLTEQGLGDFEYILGERGSKAADPSTWTSHAWIRQGRTIIDITADQFTEVTESVIVVDGSPVARHVQPESVACGRLPRLRRIHQVSPWGAYLRIVAVIEKLPTR